MCKQADNEIEIHLRELLESDPTDFEEIEEYISDAEDCYGGDLYEFAFREAIRCGALNYVEAYAGDFDLNDADGYSTYLYETDDPTMQEILMDHGAFRSWDDYVDCRFAVETVNGSILAFDDAFREEVLEKYLSAAGLTREKVIGMLDGDYDPEETPTLSENLDRCIEEDFDALGVSVEAEKIVFSYMIGENGYQTRELLEELGWECDFEGDSWKLETIGVFYIE